jgi:hypothetical protein
MRYHFNIVDGETTIPDEEGEKLSGLRAALVEARLSALEFTKVRSEN